MRELDTLHVNKNTLNSGYIFFDDEQKAKQVKEIVTQLNIGHNPIIVKSAGITYYGFKLYRMKKQFFKLCVELKEVYK